MNASFHQILLAFLRQPESDAPRWLRPLFYGLCALALAVVLWFVPTHQIRLAILAGVTALSLFGLWIVLIASLMEQNQPVAARLVPGHLRRLRQAMLLSWLAMSAVQAGLMWVALGFMGSLPLLLLCCAITNVFFAMAQRYWTLWVVFSVGPAFILPMRLDERWAPQLSAMADAWRAQPWLWLGLSLLALAALLPRMLGRGDAAHHAVYAAHTRLRKASRDGMASNRTGLAVFGRAGERLATPFDAIASVWLARLLATARPSQSSVMARTEVALHGLQHWLRQAMNVSIGIVVVGLGFAIGFALAGAVMAAAWKSAAFGLGIALASVGLSPGLQLPVTLWHTRREQALLALLPGMPQGRALNRAVAWMQLRHFGVAWVLTTLATALLAHAADKPSLMCIPLAALPVAAVSLTRAPARMRALTPWTSGMPLLAFFIVGGLLVPLQALVGLAPAALFSVLISTALLAWRWPRVLAAPPAMPAGRLA